MEKPPLIREKSCLDLGRLNHLIAASPASIRCAEFGILAYETNFRIGLRVPRFSLLLTLIVTVK